MFILSAMHGDTSFQAAVRRRYNEIDRIWDPRDRWHQIARRRVDGVVSRLTGSRSEPFGLVVDVGSGGLPQAVRGKLYVQADIAEAKLAGQRTAVCADAHSLPFADAVADCVLCVGSVANYCSLETLVGELSRVAAPGASMVIHVELTDSLEFLWRPMARADAARVTTHYQGSGEETWCYSLAYTERLLAGSGFRVVASEAFHTASALAFRFGVPPKWASYLAVLDPVLGRFPAFRRYADSVVITCRRAEAPGHS